MKIILNTCKGREHLAAAVLKEIPEAIVNFDDFTDKGKFTSTAFFNYQRGWQLVGNDDGLQLDDDIRLTSNFMEKLTKAISEHPNRIIQFFSMRKADRISGTRLENGGNFMMQQCYYLPKPWSAHLYDYSKQFYEETKDKFCPSDICIANFMRNHKLKYVVYIPNLVDHLQERSAIDRRRSSKRQSFTFVP